MKLNLRRRIKEAAMRSVNSPLGGNQRIARALLWTLRTDYHGSGSNPAAGRIGRASCCITIDFDVSVPSRFEANRKGTSALLELADAYNIPLTWAVCGKSAEDDLKSYSAIVSASTRDEVGVHTYGHIDAAASTRERFQSDVKMCIQTLGLESPRSFVFPWNREAHHDVLVELGFKAFRGKDRAIGVPTRESGLWNVRPVYYLDQKSIGAESLIKRYVDFCVRYSGVFHLWSHPWSLTVDGNTKPMEETLGSVFEYISEKRRQGLMQPFTMGDLAASLEAESAPMGTTLPSDAEARPSAVN